MLSDGKITGKCKAALHEKGEIMKKFIPLMAIIPCFLIAREHTPETKFMNQEVDCHLIAILKDRPLAEKMNEYCNQKIYMLTQATIYSKAHHGFDKEWYYVRGQIDAFNQIMDVYEMKD